MFLLQCTIKSVHLETYRMVLDHTDHLSQVSRCTRYLLPIRLVSRFAFESYRSLVYMPSDEAIVGVKKQPSCRACILRYKYFLTYTLAFGCLHSN